MIPERVPLSDEIVSRFRDAYASAQDCGLSEPSSVTLATADAAGRPSSRTVLLKAFDERGFVVYTNFESRKGRQLRENRWASLTFYWGPLTRQVHVEGPVEQVDDAEADAYWVTRDRMSQIGAWASLQSTPLPHPGALVKRVAQVTAKYALGTVPRPPHWSGFRVHPVRVEFWDGKLHRLHERDVFTAEDGVWVGRRHFP